MKKIQRANIFGRVCDPAWRNPLDVSYSKHLLYLNATIVVAAGNARRAYQGEIATLFDLAPAMRPHLQIVRVAPLRVVDAVTAEGLRALTLPQRYPRGVGIERTQSIGSRAYEANALGIACRTADATRRTTIVIEGEELAVFDIALDRVSAQKPLSFADWYPLETGRAEPLSDEDRLNP